jgi:hypothetical protein
MNKKPITQEHGTGCGVACTAYVLGVSYQSALKLFDKPGNASTTGFYCKDIVRALARKGRLYSHCYLKSSKRDLLQQAGVIVYIQRSKKYPLGHYLVRGTNGKWMNPWYNYPCIAPAKGQFQTKLPGKPIYAIFPLPKI